MVIGHGGTIVIGDPAPTGRRPRTVFLCTSRQDRAFALRAEADLAAQGIQVVRDEAWRALPPIAQGEALRVAIREADVFLLVASPAARVSRSVRSQLTLAQMSQRPLYTLWAVGKTWAEARPAEAEAAHASDARGARYADALQEFLAFYATVPPHPASPAKGLVLPTEPSLPLIEPRNPYRGLRPFTEEQANDFFGREQLIGQLLHALQAALAPARADEQKGRLLALVGPSGSGKSSAVLAGLLPRLQAGALPGSEQWVYLTPMVPDTHPFESLVDALLKGYPERPRKVLHEDLVDMTTSRGLHQLARGLVRPAEAKVVLVIDQFEELFTKTSDEQERQHFIDLLVTAVTEPRGPLVILLTLRADFYDRPMLYRELGALLATHHCPVLSMGLEELRTVIEGPAALPEVELFYEESLVEALLLEMRGQPGALPLLQFTLDELFRRRSGDQLTLAAYRELGGVSGALAQQAEATYLGLASDDQRRLARALFLRLIDPGATEQDTTRRRAALSELVLSDQRQTQGMQEVADAFVSARLLFTDQIAGKPTIEVSHEALIREWKRLRDWLREAREDLPVLQRLSSDAAEWEQRKRPGDRLYRGTQLKEAEAWAKRNLPSGHEAAFLHASRRQRTRARARGLAITLLFLLLAGGAAGLLYQLQHSISSAKLQGVHDSNLQLYLTATESASYVIPGDPAHYSLSNLPRSIAALRIDASSTTAPYRIALGIHSLQQGHFGLILQEVDLVVDQVAPVPTPLNVWAAPQRSYNTNVFQVVYSTQQQGSRIPGTYVTFPDGNVQLLPGETDEIDLQVLPKVAVDLQFRIQVTYRVSNKSQEQTLTLPNHFEVIASDVSNWHLYHLQDGSLVPSP